MKENNDGGPAFPQDLQGRRGDDPQYQGMTLRDWLAGQALAGLCSGNMPFCPDQVSATAYGYADAMLKAREASNDSGA